jgi:sulfide:quinone oxidoreductase
MAQEGKVKKAQHRIVILGGGTAGIITASLLRRAGQMDVAVVEPSDRHFYQPL